MKKIRSVLALTIFAVSGLCFGQVSISAVYVSSSTATTATIVWTTNVPSTSQVLYGYNIALQWSNTENFSLVTSHSMTLTLLNASQPYYFAVTSTNGAGQSSQSSTYQFALCGLPTVPVSGAINQFYYNGTYTMTWNAPSGSSGTPTVCGQTLQQTVTGSLNISGAFAAAVADSMKVTPGPGTWTVTVADAGNLSPVSVTLPLSTNTQDISTQLQIAASSAGLTGVLANTNAHTVYPSWIGSGGSFPSGTTNQLLYYAAPGTTLTPLTLGTNLSITGGVLNASLSGSTNWSALVAGTNTGQAFLIGTGGSLGTTGGGTIAATTAVNLASYPILCTGGQFSQGLSSGSNNCATPSGGGTITGVTAGTGLSGGGTTGTVTVNLANTTVTAGNYTNANITVNAQGQITSASNGSGGGGDTITSPNGTLTVGGTTTNTTLDVANAATFNNGGAGAASGTTYNGSAARTISYNTLGAPGLAAATNTYTGTTNDFSGTSQLKHPVAAGYVSAANGELGYDSTNLNWHGWQNAADMLIAFLPKTGVTSGHCVQFLLSTGSWSLSDSGAACGSGGSGTVSGQAAGVIPLGTSATVIGAQSHCDDGVTTAGTVTCSEPIVTAGSTHGLTIPAGTAVAGALGQVVYTTDATNGYAEVNEDNNGLARVCTASNASTVSGCYPTAVNSLTGTANEIVVSASTGAVTASLATVAKTRSCEVVWTGTGTSNALQAGDDAAANYSCANGTNATETITGIACYTDVASSTTTITPTLGNTGTGTSILTGSLTCGSSRAYAWGTLSGTPTLTSSSCPGVSCVAQGITPAMGGTLTGTVVHLLVTYTMP